MKEWEIFKNKDFKNEGDEECVPLAFHEVLEVIKDTDLTKEDLRVSVNKLEYLPGDKKKGVEVYSNLDRCFIKGESLEGPLLLLLFRLGRLSFRICQ